MSDRVNQMNQTETGCPKQSWAARFFCAGMGAIHRIGPPILDCKAHLYTGADLYISGFQRSGCRRIHIYSLEGVCPHK